MVFLTTMVDSEVLATGGGVGGGGLMGGGGGGLGPASSSSVFLLTDTCRSSTNGTLRSSWVSELVSVVSTFLS